MKNKLTTIVLLINTLLLIRCNTGETTKISTTRIKQDTLALTHSWEKAIPNQKIPQGLVSLSAEQCGICHKEHYKEWKTSTHAHAWTDMQFQAELKKESSPYLCINCHIPLQNQQKYIVTGLINGDIYQPVEHLNPKFDKNLKQEGINCASCHVRNGAVIGPTGTTKAPHKTIKDTNFLSEKLCIGCHNANAVVTPTLACTFQTGEEWKAGPYYGKKTCITCHMLEKNRENVAGFGKRKSHLHYFMGSGIPKVKGEHPKMLNGLAFHLSKLKNNYHKNDSLNFIFKVKNVNAGHRVPTGDPERFFIIKFQLLNNGTIIINKTKRIGERWQWYPIAKKLSDNNIYPLEERSYRLNTLLKKQGIYQLKVEVTKHRMSKKTAKYNKLSSNYPLFITIFNKDFTFTVNK